MSNNDVTSSDEGDAEESVYAEINERDGAENDVFDSVTVISDNDDRIDNVFRNDDDDDELIKLDDESVDYQDDYIEAALSDTGDNEDLYSLFSIPIVGMICGVFLFIFKRYKNRILLRVLTRLFDWIDGGDVDNNLPNTTSTSADTTLVKTRLSEWNLSLCQSSSFSTHSDSVLWTNRIFTDAKNIP